MQGCFEEMSRIKAGLGVDIVVDKLLLLAGWVLFPLKFSAVYLQRVSC